jgi:hypothetical protein
MIFGLAVAKSPEGMTTAGARRPTIAAMQHPNSNKIQKETELP